MEREKDPAYGACISGLSAKARTKQKTFAEGVQGGKKLQPKKATKQKPSKNKE